MDRVLIIDDDDRLAAMLGTYLEQRGLRVDRRADATSGIAAIRRGDVDAVVLDVMLPDRDGFAVCREVRAFSDVPILMLTARGEDTDRIVGLELGADDYLPKPFNPRELLARLHAILRRRNPATTRSTPVLRFGDLEIDRDRHVATVAGVPCVLTSHQYDLLRVLAENAGRVLSRAQLMERVRGEELEAFDRSIDIHISRIRAAIGDDAKGRILTIRGAGYLFTGTTTA